MRNPVGRFSTRVDNYVKYRPDYPPAIIEHLRDECGLHTDSSIADVGSGTGKLSELFLKNGNRVYGVEPNREMREAGERLLSGYERFKSVDGSAEATTLAAASVDFVTAGQAFHWFDHAAARREFARILKPGGYFFMTVPSRGHVHSDYDCWRYYPHGLRAIAAFTGVVDGPTWRRLLGAS